MKKFLVLALAAAFFAKPAAAFSGETVNAKAAKSFNAVYNGASSIWSDRNGCADVLFFWHNTLMESYYAKDGSLIATFHQVDYTALPYDAQKVLATSYKKFHINCVSMMERPGEDPVYYVSVQNRHTYILEISLDGNVDLFKYIR